MKRYPLYDEINSLDQVQIALTEIARLRDQDIRDFNNLTNIFMRGRKVEKVPSGAADVAALDRVGDFNYTASYLYILVNNSGTNAWRRVALSSW